MKRDGFLYDENFKILRHKVLERTSVELTVLSNGIPQRWEILGQHEFTSERKRMSIVLREITSPFYRPGESGANMYDSPKSPAKNAVDDFSMKNQQGSTVAGSPSISENLKIGPLTPARSSTNSNSGAGKLEPRKPGQVVMFIKGADTIMLERMNANKTDPKTLEGVSFRLCIN